MACVCDTLKREPARAPTYNSSSPPSHTRSTTTPVPPVHPPQPSHQRPRKEDTHGAKEIEIPDRRSLNVCRLLPPRAGQEPLATTGWAGTAGTDGSAWIAQIRQVQKSPLKSSGNVSGERRGRGHSRLIDGEGSGCETVRTRGVWNLVWIRTTGSVQY